MAGQNVTTGATIANTVSTVTFSRWFSGIEIVNSGADDLWARADGVNPTIGGDDCQFIPSRSWIVLRNLMPQPNSAEGITSNTVVKFISATATSYTVSGGV